MDIVYVDEKLKKLCHEEKTASKKLGPICAKKLRTRLADLDAATAIGDLVAGRPHPLKGDRRGQFAVDLEGGVRLCFEPANDSVPKREDDSIDWSKVTAVRIVYIGDYHD